jgi:arylsulfatase A-like enzyme
MRLPALFFRFLLFGSISCAALAAPARPNIVLIVADDLGYGELGCQGNPEIPTPHIDSIASSGVRFTHGYVTAPYCCPSRAGLMTGRYQTRFGHELNVIGKMNLDENVGLPLSERTLADYLKEAGYATGMVGKWHLGGTAKFHPQRRGFDSFFGFLHEGHFYVPPPYQGVTSFLRTNALPAHAGRQMRIGNITWSTHLPNSEPPYDAGNPVLRGTEELVEPAYLTDAFTREAVAFIEQNQNRPFFLYLPHLAVHSPMQASAKYLERFAHLPDLQRRIFAGMLSALDDSVGAVLAKLRDHGLEENTLIFFLSDNGGPTVELTSSNHPFRGGKGQLYEGGIRIPFMVQWKARLPAGKVYQEPVISLDILPTALAAAGLEFGVPPGDGTGEPAKAGTTNLDGVNLLPYLRGEKSGAPHHQLFWRAGQNIALRQGNWKVIRQMERGVPNPSFQLFDLARDPGESADLSAAAPEQLQQLRTALDRMNGEMVEPLWGGGPRKR